MHRSNVDLDCKADLIMQLVQNPCFYHKFLSPGKVDLGGQGRSGRQVGQIVRKMLRMARLLATPVLRTFIFRYCIAPVPEWATP